MEKCWMEPDRWLNFALFSITRYGRPVFRYPRILDQPLPRLLKQNRLITRSSASGRFHRRTVEVDLWCQDSVCALGKRRHGSVLHILRHETSRQRCRRGGGWTEDLSRRCRKIF